MFPVLCVGRHLGDKAREIVCFLIRGLIWELSVGSVFITGGHVLFLMRWQAVLAGSASSASGQILWKKIPHSHAKRPRSFLGGGHANPIRNSIKRNLLVTISLSLSFFIFLFFFFKMYIGIQRLGDV